MMLGCILSVVICLNIGARVYNNIRGLLEFAG